MAEMGTKFECAECGTKFYDLGNPNAACPKCGTAPRRDGNEIERRAPLPRLPEPEEDTDVAVVEEEGVEEAAEELEEGVVDVVEEE